MNHKIKINISNEDIRVIKSIIKSDNDRLVCRDYFSSLTLEDAVTLGILKQVLREVNCIDKQ